MGGARGQGLVKRPNLRASVCLRKRGSIKSTRGLLARWAGGTHAHAGWFAGCYTGRRVDGLDASEKPISKSDSILGTEGQTDDGDGGTREAAAQPAEKPARIIASSALHYPDSANSMSAPPGLNMRVRSVYSGCVATYLMFKCFRRFPSPVMGEIVFIPS